MKIKHIFSMMVLALVGAACSDDEEQLPGFALDTQDLKMEAVGGTREVKVTVPGNWTATPSESWVQVSPAHGKYGETCIIKVDTTLLANEQRKAAVRFVTRDDAEARTLSIVQEGFKKALTLSETIVSLVNYADFGKRYFDVEVTSNVEFEVKIPEEATSWISYDKYKFTLDRGATPRKTTIRFNWEGNTDPQNREAKVLFVVKDEDMAHHDALLISQDRAPEITPDAKGDSLALVIIERKLNSIIGDQKWDKSEPMMNWSGVRLWEEKDRGCTPENMGRVRAVEFSMFYTKEGIPDEIRHLTALETLSFFSNGNEFMCSFDAGTAITELTNLKHLRIFAFGLATLPEEFKNLKNLETLDLSSNNFAEVPAVLTPENFPNLKHLNLSGNRKRYYGDDLTIANFPKEEWGGLYYSNGKFVNGRNILEQLFSWENLESLQLSQNILKGAIPAMNKYNMPKWTEKEVMANDTLKNAAEVLVGKPKVLPHCKVLKINGNYLRGEVPDWVIHHPWFMYWSPDMLIFNQQNGKDDDGNMPGFTNIPESYEYFYELYPLLKPEY